MHRLKKLWQKLTRGWTDEETWDFEDSFLRWILPRMKRYRDIAIAFPAQFDPNKWLALIDEFIEETEEILGAFDHERDYSLLEVEVLFGKRTELVKKLAAHMQYMEW